MSRFDDEAKRIASQAETMSVDNLVAKAQHLAENMPGKWGNPTERKILAAKFLRLEAQATVTDICGKLEIDRTAWYRSAKKPDWNRRCVDFAIDMKGQRAPEVMGAFLANAEGGHVQAEIEYLRDVGAMSRAERGDSTINVNIAVVEQKRNQSIKTGLERFGYTVDTD